MKTLLLTDEEIQSLLTAINAFHSEFDVENDPPDQTLDSAEAKLIAARDGVASVDLTGIELKNDESVTISYKIDGEGNIK